MRLRPRARNEAIAEGSAAKKQERRDITVLVSEEAGTGRLAFGRYVAKIWDEIDRVKESPRWIRRCARSKGMGYMARIPYRRRGSRAHAEQEVGAETDLHNLLWGARANLNAGQLPRFWLERQFVCSLCNRPIPATVESVDKKPKLRPRLLITREASTSTHLEPTAVTFQKRTLAVSSYKPLRAQRPVYRKTALRRRASQCILYIA